MKISRITLLVFLLSCNFLFASSSIDLNNYKYVVTKVKVWNYKDSASTKIFLSNGTIWNLSKVDKMVGKKPFVEGDEVFISVRNLDDKKGGYWVESEDVTVIANLGQRQLPTLISKEKVCVKKSGWFSLAEYEYVWKLSDGSKWVSSIVSDDYNQWEIGDRVLVSSKFGSNYEDWMLINTDRDIRKKTPQQFIDMGIETRPYYDIRLEAAVKPSVD